MGGVSLQPPENPDMLPPPLPRERPKQQRRARGCDDDGDRSASVCWHHQLAPEPPLASRARRRVALRCMHHQ